MPELDDGPVIDLAQVGGLLLAVEERHHQQGWHEHANPWVYLIYDHHHAVTDQTVNAVSTGLGPLLSNDRYTALPILNPVLLYHARGAGEPGHLEAVERFVLNVAYADTDLLRRFRYGTADRLLAFRRVIRLPGIAGFAHCGEINVLSDPTDDELAQLSARPRPLADFPRSYESRNVTMADVNDRIHIVTRRRDDGAAVLELDVPMIGAVTNLMRVLSDAATGRTPTDRASFEARYPAQPTEAG